MAASRQLSKLLEYLWISLKPHVRDHSSERPQIGKENIVEDDHNTTTTGQTSRQIHTRKPRGGNERRGVMIMVDGEDTTQMIFGMFHLVRHQMDQAVPLVRGAVIHESSMEQLALRVRRSVAKT